jgi:2-polyprenyl-3-methyl-5-hydroxy-6-metoxy-1,4-benzoquinol methylase
MMVNYWDKRYSSGGTSGEGSIGFLRDFKWDVIEKHVGKVSDVIDVGCGDLSFWDGRDCDKYVGIDGSEVIIQKNMLKRPNWNFVVSYSDNEMISMLYQADVVFCFDMLFHIMDDEVYEKTIENLARFSKKYIFIYTWDVNPFENISYIKECISNLKFLDACKYLLKRTNTDSEYQKYRNFEDSLILLSSKGFYLVEKVKNEYIDKFGSMYVFLKR